MKTKLKNASGFTIIEVLIVLAIAGLIMLVVFLAVPALQRNQRNSGRRTDGSRIAAAANDFVTNANGTTPSAGSATDATTIMANAGVMSNIGALTGNGGGACDAAELTSATGKLTVCTFAAVTFNAPAADAAVVATGAQCNGASTIQAGSSRQMAIVYTQETSGGAYTLACLNV